MVLILPRNGEDADRYGYPSDLRKSIDEVKVLRVDPLCMIAHTGYLT